jgi:peptide/nickel transport system substrate-binding protein
MRGRTDTIYKDSEKGEGAMKRLFFILLALILAVSLVVVGCAGGGGGKEKEQKDTLVVAMSTLHEETFLPWNGGLARIFYMDCLYETLTFLNPETLKAEPGLAESWEMSSDAKTWTFHIRQGVPFHDALGNTYGNVTAADVKYSIEGVISPASIVGPASVMRALIANVTTPDPYTVVINLNSPDPLLDTGYMSQANPVWIVSKSYVEAKGNWTANAVPVGTGPYVLKEHSPGSSITLEAIQNHWRVTPAYKYIKFLKVPEEPTRVAMLQAGECDLAPINYDSIPTVNATAGLKIISVPNSWSPYMVFGGTVPARPARWNPSNPWADVRVRKALNYAIDKQAIVDTIFHGQGRVAGAQSYVPAWMGISDWYPYNPTEAINLLAEAGYSTGFNMTIKAYTTSPGAELPTVAQAVANYWEAVGIHCTVYVVDYTTVVRPEWTGDNATTYIFPHRGMSMTDSIQPIKSAFDKNSSFVVYADNDTEALKADILASSDPVYRETKATEFGELLKTKAAIVPIAFCNEPYGASQYVASWPALSVTVTNIYKITRP